MWCRQIGVSHIGIDAGDTAAGYEMKFASESRLHRPRAHRDHQDLDVETVLSPKIELLHQINRRELNRGPRIGHADFRGRLPSVAFARTDRLLVLNPVRL